MTDAQMTALRAAAAFLVTGGYVMTMARLAERVGSKLGGLILALPSVILVGVIFIAWSEGHEALRAASAILPATIAAATVFLAVFIRLSRFGLLASYTGAIVVWLAITIPLAMSGLDNVLGSVGIAIVIFAITISIFRHTPHRAARPLSRSLRTSLVRFGIAGTSSAATVVVSYLAGPTWGAVCASYPAVFSASLYLMTKAQGIEFTASLGRTMVIGCMANSVFGCAVWISARWLSSAPAIIVSYIAALLFGALAHRYLIDALGKTPATR